MYNAYLLIGSNMGDRKWHLTEAIHHLCAIGNIEKKSSIYETAAWGKLDQNSFLNQALLLKTKLTAEKLLNNLMLIEEKMGRKRLEKYGPRIIDIDILLMDDKVIHTEMLTLPHPAMTQRKFTLQPLAEIAPDVIHPVYKKNIKMLLKECTDELEVEKLIGLKNI